MQPQQRPAPGRRYSAAWLHHKGRNKHHLEYWIDYAPDGDHAMAGMRMPARYVAEMVCDRIAASKNYKGDKYTDAAAWEYYDRSRDHYILHPETRKELETCLLILRDEARTPASGISVPSCSAKSIRKRPPQASRCLRGSVF